MNAQYGSHFRDPNMGHAQGDDSDQDYQLVIRQQPQQGRVALGKDKDRKPIDPPPIVQLKRSQRKDPAQNFLHSPYLFMNCILVRGSDDSADVPSKPLVGTIVSSLHRLRDSNNQDGGFFIFGDLSVKTEGTFRLKFVLYELRDGMYELMSSITTDPFTVHPAKSFPGMAESTFLTRSFSDQGVRLRLRKDSRTMTTRKRNREHAEVARNLSDWDTKHDPSRQNSILEGDVTPTERSRRSFATTNYYDHGSHRGRFGDSHHGDPSYYDPNQPTKRRMQRPMAGNELSQSPTYMDVHELAQNVNVARPAFQTDPGAAPPIKRMRHSMPGGGGGEVGQSTTYLGAHDMNSNFTTRTAFHTDPGAAPAPYLPPPYMMDPVAVSVSHAPLPAPAYSGESGIPHVQTPMSLPPSTSSVSPGSGDTRYIYNYFNQ